MCRLLLLLSHFSRVPLCDPIVGSPPASPVPEILQARTLQWVAISFSNAWRLKVKVKSLIRVWLPETPWTAAQQAPLSMGFSRQEYWSGLPLPCPYMCIYTYMYILFHVIFHCNLSQDIKYSSLSYTVGPRCVSSLQITVRISASQPPHPSLPATLPCGPTSLFCVCESVPLSQTCSSVSHFALHMQVVSCDVCLSFWLTSFSDSIPRSMHVAADGIISFFSMAE